MDAVTRKILRLDRPLDLSTAMHRPPCKICGASTHEFAVTDFRKFCNANQYGLGFSGIPVYYFRCDHCDCTFTTFFDDWSTNDFADLVYNEGYLRVDPEYTGTRAQRTAMDLTQRFKGLEDLCALDYGSGSGHFSSVMNERGFNFASFDPFSSPERPRKRFDFVVSFEVIEHSPSPIATFDDMFSLCGPEIAIIFGQTLQPDDIMQLRANWWYLAPRNGHVTTYSHRTLSLFAKERGLNFHVADGLYGLASRTLTGSLADLMSRIGRPE